MFGKLGIWNFKSHKKTELNFHPGVNVIIGPPQSGKTSIGRAILLVAMNRPLGVNCFSTFLEEDGITKIQLSLLEGPKVSLERQLGIRKGEKYVKKATYYLDKEPYQGLNKGVPDLIHSALNIGELNVQKQFAMPFLILSSAGEVARVFNRVTKLEMVDTWVSGFTTKINTANTSIDLATKQAEDIGIKLKQYSNLRRERVTLKRLVAVDKHLAVVRRKHLVLDALLVTMEETDESIRRLEKFLEAESSLSMIEQLDKEFLSLVLQKASIEELLSLNKRIEELEKFQIVEKEIRQIDKIEVEFSSLFLQRDLIQDIIDFDEEILELEKSFSSALSEYANELISSGKCPTCFSVIDKGRMKKIIKELKGGIDESSN